VILDEKGVSLGINPAESVGAEAVHAAVAIGYAPLREEEHYVLDTLRIKADKVPGHVRVANVGLWVALAAVDYIRELDWIPNEEEGCIVEHPVLVSLLCVELYCEATGITICIAEALLTKCC